MCVYSLTRDICFFYTTAINSHCFGFMPMDLQGIPSHPWPPPERDCFRRFLQDFLGLSGAEGVCSCMEEAACAGKLKPDWVNIFFWKVCKSLRPFSQKDAFWKSLTSSLEALPGLDAWWQQLGMATSSRLPTYVIWKGCQKKRIARITQADPESWVSSWVYMKVSQKHYLTSAMIRLIQMTFQTSMCKFLNLWIHMQLPCKPRQTRRSKWIQSRRKSEKGHFQLWHWTHREGLLTRFDFFLQAKWRISTTRWNLHIHLQMASRQWPSQHFGKCGRKICLSWSSDRSAITHNAQLVYDTNFSFVQWTDTWSVDKTKCNSTSNT